MTTPDTVTQYYRGILFRDPTQSEVAGWTAIIDNSVVSLEQARAAFIASPEATQFVTPIVRLYQSAFGRVPDQAGLDGWADAARANPSVLDTLASQFIQSAEGRLLYGPGNDVGVPFVTALYLNVLGRAPDAEGFNFWLNSGFSRDQVLLQFSESTENRARSASGVEQFLTNSAQGTETFTGNLYDAAHGGAPDSGESTFTLIPSASSVDEGGTVFLTLDTANVAPGQNLQYKVTGIAAQDLDGGSLTGTLTVDASGQAVVALRLREDTLTEGPETLRVELLNGRASADVVVNDTSLSAAPVGQVLGLTPSVDKVVGTAQNDTVNAVISATAASTTLTGLDQIDGGDGDDTLNIVDDNIIDNIVLPAGSKVQNIEVLNVTSNRTVGVSESSRFDSSSFAGLKVETVSAGAAYLKVASGVDLTVTTGTGVADIDGGNTVLVTSAGDANVKGAQDVTVNTNADADITGGTKVAVTSKGGATVNEARDVTIDAGGTADVFKATGAVSVKSGGSATVKASETSDVTISSGAEATVTGARAVDVAANGDVGISGATGAIAVNDRALGATISVAGGTTVNVTGVGSDVDSEGLPTGGASSNTVTIGAAPAIGPGSSSGYSEVISNLSSNPTGDVAVDFSTAYTDADGKAGVVFGTGATKIYTNGATTVTATGVGATVITDVQTTELQAASTAAAAPGTSTLEAVNLTGLSGTATITSDALAKLSVLDSAGGNTVTVVNNTEDHALDLTVGNTGSSDGKKSVNVTVEDATATSISIGTQASAYQVTNGAAVNAGSASFIALNAAKAASVFSSGDADLNLDLTANTAQTSFDGSAATGDIVLTGLGSKLASISTGSGDDTFTVETLTEKDDSTTTTDINEVASAVVSSGDGNDEITINTDGDNTTTVNAGGGSDSVTVTKRSTGVLTVNLGDGDDSFASVGQVQVGKNDVIDAGAGSDTLLLRLVGSANVGAFRNFDVFDAKGLTGALDTSLLTAKNTVTEFVASGPVISGAALTNVGAGVGFRATGDMAGSTLSLTQATAGAITVTLDADEVDGVAGAGGDVNASVGLKNATSVKAVFDTAFTDKLSATVENTADMIVAADAATTLEVVSGGAEALNRLDIEASVELTSAKVSGAQALDLFSNGATTKLASVDASAHTGGLTFSLADLADEGTVTLGSGRDVVTVTNASTVAGIESIAGFEAVAAVDPADAAALAAAIADADQLALTGAKVANAPGSVVTGGTVANGVLDFTGAGPATLSDALDIADVVAEGGGEAVLFEYGGSSYVFVQSNLTDQNGPGLTDTVVRLADVTGVTNLIQDETTDFFVIA